MIRTRFAPSPTGSMHIGNLRTALYTYLIAKNKGGKFVLRIEDTDQVRFVEGATEIIYNTLKTMGLLHDEGPDVGGNYGPYTQSERIGSYMKYAVELVESKKAYYCFCTKERLETLTDEKQDIMQYDRHCLSLNDEEIKKNLDNNTAFVIRQIIPEGSTTFVDEGFGEITVDNATLDDQVLIKSDGFATYNFANVIDDHLMEITHVVRGSEYLSSTPKYNLLYEAFEWKVPIYVHLPLIVNQDGAKMSKRRGDGSVEDLMAEGFLPEAILNYIALLGWSPANNQEVFSLEELTKVFDTKRISKSPSAFDIVKLTWFNGEYFKKMDSDEFFKLSENIVKASVKKACVDCKKLSDMVKSRISFVKEIPELLDFIDALPEYSTKAYIHKKMKTTEENSLISLKEALEVLKSQEDFSEKSLHDAVFELIEKMEIKNGLMLWPLRAALSGKESSPCGAIELLEILGKEESLRRIEKGIKMLSK
ncbi:MAG: glutamate--tRNA ligase [Defluviitaleaceae bacterium]|nr:glutamate--tRNA ligase [Defluviitaleaceae bacterium]